MIVNFVRSRSLFLTRSLEVKKIIPNEENDNEKEDTEKLRTIKKKENLLMLYQTVKCKKGY